MIRRCDGSRQCIILNINRLVISKLQLRPWLLNLRCKLPLFSIYCREVHNAQRCRRGRHAQIWQLFDFPSLFSNNNGLRIVQNVTCRFFRGPLRKKTTFTFNIILVSKRITFCTLHVVYKRVKIGIWYCFSPDSHRNKTNTRSLMCKVPNHLSNVGNYLATDVHYLLGFFMYKRSI